MALARPDQRFDRLGRLVGPTALNRLGAAHVLIFGVGGVGTFAAEALARSGVGHLTLVDGERICPTNSNRQLHALEGAFGRMKAEAMAERLKRINPAAQVDAVLEFYAVENSERLLEGRPDFVIDAIDSVNMKLHLLAACVRQRLPVVSAMGAARRLDPTAVRVTDLCDSHTDQFAKDVRKYLRARHGICCTEPTGIRAVWSTEPARTPRALPGDEDGLPGVRTLEPEERKRRREPKCHGSASFVTGVFGLVAAAEVVRLLAESPTAPDRSA